jgi:hypothetical protein
MYKVQATFSAYINDQYFLYCLEFQVLLKQYLTFKNSLKFRVQKFEKPLSRLVKTSYFHYFSL